MFVKMQFDAAKPYADLLAVSKFGSTPPPSSFKIWAPTPPPPPPPHTHTHTPPKNQKGLTQRPISIAKAGLIGLHSLVVSSNFLPSPPPLSSHHLTTLSKMSLCSVWSPFIGDSKIPSVWLRRAKRGAFLTKDERANQSSQTNWVGLV